MEHTQDARGHWRFRALHQAHRTAIGAQLAAAGLAGVGSPWMLAMLHETTGAAPSQRELAARVGVSPAVVTNSLKSLERLGYVAREADARDGRRNRVRITPGGRAAVEGCAAVFQRVDDGMYEGFSPEELARLDGYFDRMVENLRHMGGRVPECFGGKEAAL